MGLDLYLYSEFRPHHEKYHKLFEQWVNKRDRMERQWRIDCGVGHLSYHHALDTSPLFESLVHNDPGYKKAQENVGKYFNEMYAKGYWRDTYNCYNLLSFMDIGNFRVFGGGTNSAVLSPVLTAVQGAKSEAEIDEISKQVIEQAETPQQIMKQLFGMDYEGTKSGWDVLDALCDVYISPEEEHDPKYRKDGMSPKSCAQFLRILSYHEPILYARCESIATYWKEQFDTELSREEADDLSQFFVQQYEDLKALLNLAIEKEEPIHVS